MATHTLNVFSKEQGGGAMGQNPASAFSTVPWLTGLGSQAAAFDENFAQHKIASSENSAGGKGHTARFTIFPGESKISGNMQKFKLQNGGSLHTATAENQKYFHLGFSQPVICATYPYGEQCYGVFSAYGRQLAGHMMVPLNSVTDEGTIFVNAKQYNGIIRRRQYRAKAELENKLIKNRKPYLHLSRHLHAMRRPRGCGGRFLNTKNSNAAKGNAYDKKIGEGQFSQITGSQSSEVPQSDSGNSSSPRESTGRRSNNLGSEVTSVYSREDLDPFNLNHICHTTQSLPNMMNTGQGIVLPSNWVAAAISAGGDGCRKLKV